MDEPFRHTRTLTVQSAHTQTNTHTHRKKLTHTHKHRSGFQINESVDMSHMSNSVQHTKCYCSFWFMQPVKTDFTKLALPQRVRSYIEK